MKLYSLFFSLFLSGAMYGWGSPTVFYDIDKGDKAAVVEAIEKGLNLKIRTSEGDTLLHVAAKNRNPDIVALLLDRGCDVNASNARGEAPLHVAIKYAKSNNVSALLKQGSTVDIYKKTNEGITPFDLVNERIKSYKKFLSSETISEFDKEEIFVKLLDEAKTIKIDLIWHSWWYAGVYWLKNLKQ